MGKIERRYDGFSQIEMGMGTDRDKLGKIKPIENSLSILESESWYFSNGYIQNIIDIPAEDSTREWIDIKTNREDLQISRLIQNRFLELDFQRKLKELIRYSRMYNLGGFLYYGIDHSIPQTDKILELSMPLDLNKIEYINVFSPINVGIINSTNNQLSINYHKYDIRINGIKVHPSRYDWLVQSFLPEKLIGISVIQTILDAVKAQGISIWSISSILSELSVKVFKSPSIDSGGPEKLYDFISQVRAAISTQGILAVSENESLDRLQANIPGLKDIFDFIMENLAGLAKIPKSRLLGQSQGTITGGQYDLISYYDSISKFQEIELKPILEKAIKLIINERSGKIYKALNGSTSSLDWETKFNPLWKLSGIELADVNLKNAQRDQIYITTAVLSPSEIRTERFSKLESFQTIGSENLNFFQEPPRSI
jgi:uncharacterized protein